MNRVRGSGGIFVGSENDIKPEKKILMDGSTLASLTQ